MATPIRQWFYLALTLAWAFGLWLYAVTGYRSLSDLHGKAAFLILFTAPFLFIRLWKRSAGCTTALARTALRSLLLSIAFAPLFVSGHFGFLLVPCAMVFQLFFTLEGGALLPPRQLLVSIVFTWGLIFLAMYRGERRENH